VRKGLSGSFSDEAFQQPVTATTSNSSSSGNAVDEKSGSYTFDHVERQWITASSSTDDEYDDDNSNSNNDSNNISDDLESGNSINNRKRVFSSDLNDQTMTSVLSAATWQSTLTTSYDYPPNAPVSQSTHRKVGVIGALLYFLTCVLQTGLEATVPLWIFHVLGFSATGMSVVIASIAITILIMSNIFGRQGRHLFRLPSRGPLRSIRIGLAAQFISILSLALTSRFLSYSSSVVAYVPLILISTVILCSSALSRSSGAVLHRISCGNSLNGAFFTNGGYVASERSKAKKKSLRYCLEAKRAVNVLIAYCLQKQQVHPTSLYRR